MKITPELLVKELLARNSSALVGQDCPIRSAVVPEDEVHQTFLEGQGYVPALTGKFHILLKKER